jgi:hypothetical protein
VYQETIGKTFREYLVNFDYLVRIMEDYGFVLVNKEKAIPMGLPNGSGLFGDMFRNMESETKNDNRKFADYKNAHLMTVDEKQISFMNRYFVFQKLRDVNAEKIGKLVAHKTVDELELPLAEAEEEKETAPKKITKVQGEKVTISDEVIKIKIKRKKET